jgi:hypothetical protein
MKKIAHSLLFTVVVFSLSTTISIANDSTKVVGKSTIIPDADNAGLKLPAGFGALKVADTVGRARHIVVNDKGDIYIKLSKLSNGKGIIVLAIILEQAFRSKENIYTRLLMKMFSVML